MMANARKHRTPTGSEASISRATIFDTFGNSIHDVVPVANATERSQLVTSLTAAGQAPSAANPVVVFRADAAGLHRTEYTTDGSVWVPTSGVLRFASVSAMDSWGTANGGLLTVGDRAFAADLEHRWNGSRFVGVRDAPSGVLFGSAPPAGTPLITQSGVNRSTRTNSNGDGTIMYPTEFPNGVISATLIRFDHDDYGPSLEIFSTTQSRSGLNFRVYAIPQATAAVGVSPRYAWTAIGW